MRVLELTLENIGPFDEAHLEFVSDPPPRAPIAIITGENGAGKTILIDAIRGLFGGLYCELERRLWRPNVQFRAEMTVFADGKRDRARASLISRNNGGFATDSSLSLIPLDVDVGRQVPNWVVDYWRSSLATDAYEIRTLAAQDHREYLRGALQGTYRNAAVTEQIAYFDYLRDSQDPDEKRAGEVLFDAVRRIVKASLLDGELDHVARATFMPMVRQSGHLVPLANLSSGNAYLIQHLISLLGRMYAVHFLRKTPPETICDTPGLLLIDEAENHLHPKWQKRFIPGILDVFPNLQIIATTHSPFIIASAPDARVFVCRYDSTRKSCVVSEETAAYANRPVEQILLSAAFNETQPFNEEISTLIEQRKQAVERGDDAERHRIEALLKEKNPDYFAYFDVEERLRKLADRAKP